MRSYFLENLKRGNKRQIADMEQRDKEIISERLTEAAKNQPWGFYKELAQYMGCSVAHSRGMIIGTNTIFEPYEYLAIAYKMRLNPEELFEGTYLAHCVTARNIKQAEDLNEKLMKANEDLGESNDELRDELRKLKQENEITTKVCKEHEEFRHKDSDQLAELWEENERLKTQINKMAAVQVPKDYETTPLREPIKFQNGPVRRAERDAQAAKVVKRWTWLIVATTITAGAAITALALAIMK